MKFRFLSLALAAAALPIPSLAQVYINPPPLAGEPVIGNEPGLGLPLPDASSEEYSAALVWNLRSGLNVAALQCSHSPFLETTDNYNALLSDQREDLAAAYKALTGYFIRTSGKAAGIKAFDDYNTKSYNGWSTLYAQRGFCNEASSLGKQLRFVPKKQMLPFAQAHMREFRNSLTVVGDPLWATRALYVPAIPIPNFPANCYNKNGEVKPKCLR